MSRTLVTAAVGLALAVGAPRPAAAQQALGPELQGHIWFDRGEEPVVDRGDRVRLYYRTSQDAYVAVVHIDTDGTANLLFPSSPEESHYVRGGQDYRLLFPRSPYWYVEDSPGIGYFFLIVSSQPFDFSQLPYSYYDGGWDLSRVGRRIYTDPYVAMDEYVADLIPDWQNTPYALDFATYHVGEHHDYPRFLCYNCHGFRPYNAWNPYYYTCTTFQVVIYNDPYYYPARRYRGQSVVYTRPPRPYQPRFTFKERPKGTTAAAVIETRPPGGAPAPVVRRPVGSVTAPPVTGRPSGDAQRLPPVVQWRDPADGSTRPAPGREPTPSRPTGRETPRPGSPATGGAGQASPRRPADVLRRPTPRPTGGQTAPARGGTGEGATVAPPSTSRPSTPPEGQDVRRRPVLQRRPSGSGQGEGRSGGDAPVVRPARPREQPPANSSGGGRPSSTTRSRGGATTAPAPQRPQASPPAVRRPSGGGSTPPRSQPRSSGGSRPAPARHSGGSSPRPAARPRPRAQPKPRARPQPAARPKPTARSQPSPARSRPSSRGSGGAPSGRVVRRPGGGAAIG